MGFLVFIFMLNCDWSPLPKNHSCHNFHWLSGQPGGDVLFYKFIKINLYAQLKSSVALSQLLVLFSGNVNLQLVVKASFLVLFTPSVVAQQAVVKGLLAAQRQQISRLAVLQLLSTLIWCQSCHL